MEDQINTSIVAVDMLIREPSSQNMESNSNHCKDYTPHVGQEFDSEDAAYTFYYEYGRQTGFNIRKEYGNWNRKGELTSRRFVCCNEGFRGRRKRDHQVKNPRPDTRTGCLARMVISFDREKKNYRISDFMVEHNHCLHILDSSSLMSSQSKMPTSQACAVGVADAPATCSESSRDYNPYEGQEFDSEDAAYDFYIAYARQTGFSIRKEYGNKNRVGELTSRSFVCCKEGFRGPDKQEYQIKKLRPETRTGCRAKMVISLDRMRKKYRVSVFVAEHNHWLHSSNCGHIPESHAKMSDSQACEVDSTDASDVTSEQPNESMDTQTGGRDDLGCSQVDQRTCQKSKCQRVMRSKEAGNLLRSMKDQTYESNGVVEVLVGDASNQDVGYNHNQLGDYMPYKGQEFDSEDAAYNFYNAYGRKIGFSIRKEYGNKNRAGELTSRRFVCCKEGFRGLHKRDRQVKNHRPETRTGCPARMVIRLDREKKKYQVSDLIVQHNHCLHRPECADMLPSQRKMSKSQADEVDQPKQPNELMDMQRDETLNSGLTREEQQTFLQSRQQRDSKNEEAEKLSRHFQKQACENSSFYYAMHLNSVSKITSIFWVDSKMIIDFVQFGDVITFNTTYKTNKEDWTCGVFAGFNHHRQIVIFGAALLLEETMESYEWLFGTLLQAMSHKKPKTIFTDQDLVIAKVISAVMPETYHGLCTWHVMKNGPKHLGHLFKKGSGFLADFKSCMFTYEDETELHAAWYGMLLKYNVGSNPWLHDIFKLKEKWAEVYMKRVCTLGMRKTQFNESLHASLKDYLNSDLELVQFYKHFENMVDSKRHKELEAEYQARQKLPNYRMTKSPMLNQAGQVYTPAIFEEFQEQYDEYLATFIKYRNEMEETREYVVAIVGSHEERRVTGNLFNKTVSCSCRKFETIGILCSHALKVLDVMDIKLIPDQYILKRWTRDVRNETFC